MSKTILALACLFIATSAIHLTHEQDSNGLIVNIKGSNGKYLSSSQEYISTYPVSASISETDPTQLWAQWQVEKYGDKYALKSVSTGKYISRCYDCWDSDTNSKWHNSIFVHIDDPTIGDWALWTLVQLENGKWSFKADTGKYANICYDCVDNSQFDDYAFVQVDDPKKEEAAQWEIIEVATD